MFFWPGFCTSRFWGYGDLVGDLCITGVMATKHCYALGVVMATFLEIRENCLSAMVVMASCPKFPAAAPSVIALCRDSDSSFP